MLEKNTKRQENKYHVIVGQDACWRSQEIVATNFSVDDFGNLLFWMSASLIVVIAPGNWQCAELMPEK